MHAMAAPAPPPMVLRRSVKLLIAAYAACGLLEVAIAIFWLSAAQPPAIPLWVPLLVPIALQILTAFRHLERLLAKLTISDDRVKFESGMFSKSTRVVELAKIQDVRVD